MSEASIKDEGGQPCKVCDTGLVEEKERGIYLCFKPNLTVVTKEFPYSGGDEVTKRGCESFEEETWEGRREPEGIQKTPLSEGVGPSKTSGGSKVGTSIPSPLKSIRRTCINCAHGFKGIAECEVEDCPFYPFRMGRGRGRYLKAIRKRCLWCMGGQQSLVPACTERECPSWPYRMGHRPKEEA